MPAFSLEPVPETFDRGAEFTSDFNAEKSFSDADASTSTRSGSKEAGCSRRGDSDVLRSVGFPAEQNPWLLLLGMAVECGNKPDQRRWLGTSTLAASGSPDGKHGNVASSAVEARHVLGWGSSPMEWLFPCAQSEELGGRNSKRRRRSLAGLRTDGVERHHSWPSSADKPGQPGHFFGGTTPASNALVRPNERQNDYPSLRMSWSWPLRSRKPHRLRAVVLGLYSVRRTRVRPPSLWNHRAGSFSARVALDRN